MNAHARRAARDSVQHHIHAASGGQFVRCHECPWIGFVRTVDLTRYCRDGCPECGGACSTALAEDLPTRGAK